MTNKQTKRHCHQNRKYPLPTPLEISRKFAYRPHTGEIVTKRGVVGALNAQGYLICKYSDHPQMVFMAHQIAFVLMRGYWPHLINHINGDKSDNRWENLEEVTQSENMAKARLNHCPSKGIARFSNYYWVRVNRNGVQNQVYFTLWRDAYAWNKKLIEGIRRYGPEYMPPIPSKNERIKPHMRSKALRHD